MTDTVGTPPAETDGKPEAFAVYDTAELRFVGDTVEDKSKASETAAELNKLARERADRLGTSHKRGRYEVRSV